MQRFFKFAYIQVNTKQSPVNLLHIFGSLFFKSTSEELLLKTINGKEQMNMWYKQVLMLEYFMSEFIAKSIGGKFCGCRSICKSMSFVICYLLRACHLLTSVVRSVQIFMASSRVFKSRLKPELCFHCCVHFSCVPIYI